MGYSISGIIFYFIVFIFCWFGESPSVQAISPIKVIFLKFDNELKIA